MPAASGEDGSTFKSIFTAVLILIVIAAAVFAAWYFFVRDNANSASDDLSFHFKCSKCSHEFQLSKKELNDQSSAGKTHENAGNARCPECGEKWGGVLMLECNKCGKYFVPKNEENPICSHCGANFYESMRGYDPNAPEHNPGPGTR